MKGYDAKTLKPETAKRIGECLSADYHKTGYGFDYRFKVRDTVGLYVTKWATGTRSSVGYPDNWEVYELIFADKKDNRGVIGRKIVTDIDETALPQLAAKFRQGEI